MANNLVFEAKSPVAQSIKAMCAALGTPVEAEHLLAISQAAGFRPTLHEAEAA